ncbi:MAG: class F sortase [Jatrophihabitans sp.]
MAAGRLTQRPSRPATVAVTNWGPAGPPGVADQPPAAGPGAVPADGPGLRSSAPLPTGSRLRLSRLGIDSSIVAVSLHATVLGVPRDPQVLGWWAQGASPGSGPGSVVITGHVDYAGVRGALAALPEARPGEPITLVEPARVVRYQVTAVRTYPKSVGIPASAFARSGPERLVLITCGGPFDPSTGNYLDNIVAYADPVGG